jgi:hypothetical protein
MRTLALALLLVLPATAPAQDPPRTLDQLLDRVAEIRRQREDLAKLEAATAAELRAKLKELNDRLAALGILVDPPAPKPPVPPAPKPPEPKPPADPLRESIAAAYKAAAGTDDEKRFWARDLAALYRKSARFTRDPAVATAAALRAKMAAAADVLLEGPDPLKEVRKAVAGELAAALGTAEQELTADQRTAATLLLAKLAAILDALAAE